MCTRIITVCCFLPNLLMEDDFWTTAIAGLSPKFVEPDPYDSAIMGAALNSLVARRTEPPSRIVKSASPDLIAFKQWSWVFSSKHSNFGLTSLTKHESNDNGQRCDYVRVTNKSSCTIYRANDKSSTFNFCFATSPTSGYFCTIAYEIN